MTEPNGTNGHQPWNEKLLVPFDNLQIGIRPQLWCPGCIKSDNKTCGQVVYDVKHDRKKCKVCGQNISPGHLHLYYIGHAHLTRRLIQVDPLWRWEPMHREIDHPELVTAAIATGDKDMVRMILDSFPPKLTTLEIPDGRGGTRVERGMWIRLILHTDDGTEVPMIGFGDAKGKLWGGDALKEIIGDALRNATMRRGGALGLWESQDLEQAEKERQQFDPESRGGAMALFDDEAPAIGSGKPPAPDPGAQAAIDLAWQIVQRQGADPAADIEEVRVKVNQPASRVRGQLAQPVHPPWSADPDDRAPLSAALRHVKNVLETRQEGAQDQAKASPA